MATNTHPVNGGTKSRDDFAVMQTEGNT